MEILATLNLQDHEGASHTKLILEVSDEVTVKQVMEKIMTKWHIDKRYQRLYYNGVRIKDLDFTLKQLGLKQNDEIIVKHSDLPWWPQYRYVVEAFLKSSHNRTEYAKESVELHQKLMKSGFFKAYSSFDEFRANNHSQVAAWADNDLDVMNEAVESYFHLQHGRRGGTSEGDFYYRYMPRPMNICGTRNGILVNVQLHGEEYPTKYSIKRHHFGTSSSCQKASPPDIRVIFCYKLLEVIEVGPAVQFIISKERVGNKISVYIATKWRDDFILLSNLNKDKDINVEVLVQLLLLKVLFHIDDLHGDNCGQWNGTNTAAIIDFMPAPCSAHPDVKEILLDQHRMNWNDASANLLFEKCGTERFLEIVKKWLQEWDLLSKIDEAAALIKDERDQMKMLENGFTRYEELIDTVTDDLDEYLDAVKSNVKNLTSALGLNV